MKLKYSISYFVLITALVIAFIYGFSINNTISMEEYAMLEEETEDIVLSNSEEVISDGYILKVKDRYVVVYLYDNVTLFEETDILLEDLNIELQQEIMSGKYIETATELYAFLENYSS